MEDPKKAEVFDKQHRDGPKWGRHHAGAKELASGYTTGRFLPHDVHMKARAVCK